MERDKIKKFFKIFFVNVFLLVIIIVIAEVVSFHILHERDFNFHYIFIDDKFENKYKSDWYKNNFRPDEIVKNNKKSVILFGCCMTHGTGIPDEKQTLSHYFSKYMNRTVYNRGFPGWGLQHMYFQLTDPDFPSLIKVEPEYIVYTIIHDHYRRLFSNSSANEPYYLQYRIKDNKLVKQKESFWNRSLFRYLMVSLYCDKNYDSKIVDFYILESYKQAKKLWPNVKMVILNLDKTEGLQDSAVLKENNIQVIDVTKYSFNQNIHELEDYWIDNCGHPSGKYWELVLPGVIKEIKQEKK
ncbi:MAG: hypothetical protein K6C94_01070 [Candidatus Gastranaerophilales bacterium]|nr:hypothetical protein [Candidatus Gastranaerophilales bacterium]